MNKYVLLVTGPIGAGKTQLCHYILNKTHIEYVSADYYYHRYFNQKGFMEQVAYSKAKQYFQYKILKMQREEKCFVLETVVAKKDKLEMLLGLKRKGYSIVCIFLSVSNTNLLISRAKERAKEGWYSIPDAKIVDRYKLTIDNLSALKALSDIFIEIDTTNGYSISNVLSNGESNHISPNP